MKFTKISAIALAALMFTACSDDDTSFNFNTAEGVTVEMEKAKVEVMENVGVFSVPVKVTGNPNGYVQITVECTETGEFPAIENRHYFLTTATINIPQDDPEGAVQFTSVDRRGFDENRTYNVTIVDVKGATVGANKATTVQIFDKGSSPKISELKGKWLVSGNQYNPETRAVDTPYISECNMRVVEEDGNGGGTVLLSGVMGQWQIQLEYVYDADEKYGELEFHYGTPAYTGQDIRYTNTQGGVDENPLKGKWNFSFTSATFGDANTIIAMSGFEDDHFAGLYNLMSGFTITKLPD